MCSLVGLKGRADMGGRITAIVDGVPDHDIQSAIAPGS